MQIRITTIVSALALLTAGFAAGAQELSPVFDDRVCEPPISLCRPALATDALSSSIRPDVQRCPSGYECVCVSSRPETDDCAAEVCVQGSGCKTACDCPTGLGCFEGQCIAGIAPVYCCDSDRCPAGEMCQGRDGEFGRCFDPMCQERVNKVRRFIENLVSHTNKCEQASDCVQIGTSTQCQGTCGEFVNKEYARRVSARIDWVDEEVCSTYQQDGCPFATPACLAVRPACVHNRCTGVPIHPGPPRPRPVADADRLSDAVRKLEPAR